MNSISTHAARPSAGARSLRLAVLVGAVLALHGCGGGGGDNGGDSGGELPGGGTPPPATSTGTCGLANFQQEVLDRINALRASGATCGGVAYGPTGALTWNVKLAQAADGHAKDMATKNYFDHTSQDGTTMGERITAAGYAWGSAGENIAAGQQSVQSVMEAWRVSAGHCSNMMSSGFREIGVACQPATGSNRSPYWVMNLASPR